jgi:vesicle coat complex subunit
VWYRFNDPVYVKLLKLEILELLVTPKSYTELINELSEYVTDVDVEIARKAVKSIGQIGENTCVHQPVLADRINARAQR